MASAAACFAPLCVASQSNRICTSRMPSAERRLRRLPRLRLRLASRRRPRFVRGHCLSVFCSTADSRSVFAIRFVPRKARLAVQWWSFRHCLALSSLLSRFTSLCRAVRRVIPVPLLRRYRALGPRSAQRMCNESLDDSDCANNWDSARQGLKVHHCTQSVQATRLAPILRKDRIDG